MENFKITPTVDTTQEFIEIANDFSNPLDLVREAISNSFDAGAKNIKLIFDVATEFGNDIFKVTISDDGKGMAQQQLQAFFDLGNSTKRDDKETIGEKGHGTKVFFNSAKIVVKTFNGGVGYEATMADPHKKLHQRIVPEVDVVVSEAPADKHGTEITIYGYNNNRRDKFTHERIKDYILWFTKFGSVERLHGFVKHQDTRLTLKGLDEKTPEVLTFGHLFPDESPNIEALFSKHDVEAPDLYCKRIIKEGTLTNHPEVKFEAIFSIEGRKVKYGYNRMLRGPGRQPPKGNYTVQERYGLWLTKDYIPIQRKNEWITFKGSEYTKFHAFVNCQQLRLTANRGSVDNTPSEILSDLETAIKEIYREILEGEDWENINWLEEESEGFKSAEKEKKNFDRRVKEAQKANVAIFKDHTLVEPTNEAGVYSLFLKLSTLQKDLFPFEIVDYNTHEGIDVIVKGDHTMPIHQSKLFYVEFKYNLDKVFNHSFENLHSIVCWDTKAKNQDTLIDIKKEDRTLEISPATAKDCTRYFLNHPRKAHKIEVFVLKDYLKEKIALEFRPRASLIKVA